MVVNIPATMPALACWKTLYKQTHTITLTTAMNQLQSLAIEVLYN